MARKVEIPRSPLASGRTPVTINYHEYGNGPAILLLHGGWGQQMYPFDHAIDRLSARYRIIAPDRSGYGGSGSIADLPGDFHHRAVAETFAVAEALHLKQFAIWGHSDGAVMAVLMALQAPNRICGVVLEALHLWGAKPSSRRFFERAAALPDSFGDQVRTVLSQEHGATWTRVVSMHGRAWLEIAQGAERTPDLYDGRLDELHVPALVIHGAQDPRTEPGELDAIRAAIPYAEFLIVPEGGHSPHSERAEVVTDAAADFFDRLRQPSR